MVVALAVVGVLGVAAAWWGSGPPPESPTGTAIVLEHRGGIQVVSVLDGPEPGRHEVTWAAEVPPGEPFAVALIGECGCTPWPARTVPTDGPRSPTAVGAGVLAVGLGVIGVAFVGLAATLMARYQRRARAVLGQGRGALVHVLPFWPPRGGALNAELWLVEADAPLGTIALWRADQGFDPTQPFVAWGPLVLGQPVALTSADGLQLVLPIGPLSRPLPPGPLGPVSTAAGEILGWPSRNGPGVGRDRSVVDAALAEVAARSRRVATILGAALAMVGFVVLPLPPLGRLGLVLVALATALAGLGPARRVHEPVRSLVRPVVGPNEEKLVAHVGNALTVARQPPR